eukprot:scaffold143_cov110-Isochrysis_galbana.AAC.1
MFQALHKRYAAKHAAAPPALFTCVVGRKPSAARYYVNDANEARRVPPPPPVATPPVTPPRRASIPSHPNAGAKTGNTRECTGPNAEACTRTRLAWRVSACAPTPLSPCLGVFQPTPPPPLGAAFRFSSCSNRSACTRPAPTATSPPLTSTAWGAAAP